MLIIKIFEQRLICVVEKMAQPLILLFMIDIWIFVSSFLVMIVQINHEKELGGLATQVIVWHQLCVDDLLNFSAQRMLLRVIFFFCMLILDIDTVLKQYFVKNVNSLKNNN